MGIETKGHSAAQGGLRGHSIGEAYPYTVYARGTPNRVVWGVLNCLTGTCIPYSGSCHHAHVLALELAKGSLVARAYERTFEQIELS